VVALGVPKTNIVFYERGSGMKREKIPLDGIAVENRTANRKQYTVSY
jgi:hypothetical protein